MKRRIQKSKITIPFITAIFLGVAVMVHPADNSQFNSLSNEQVRVLDRPDRSTSIIQTQYNQSFPSSPQNYPFSPSSPGPPAYTPISPSVPAQPPPPNPPGPSTNTIEKGTVDPQTGNFLPGTIGGVVNPRTGEVMPKVPGGYINPETGRVIPKQE
jgi:hypothetical protein